MKKEQRILLEGLHNELCNVPNVSMSDLMNGNAFNLIGIIREVRVILYGVFGDNDENEYRDEDISYAKESLEHIKEIIKRVKQNG